MHPRLIDIGPFHLPTYGFLLACAFLLAIWWASAKAGKRGFRPDDIADLGVTVLLASLVGSKLVLFLLSPREFLSASGALRLLQAGGVFYGGLIIASAAGLFMLHRRRLPLWQIADLVAPSIALGEVVGRLGCFAAGCCWGKPADVAWAVIFRDPLARETVGTPLGIPLHPTQIYLSLDALALFLVLEFLDRRRKFHGQVFWTYVLLHSLLRAGIEVFRGDTARGFLVDNLVSTSQAIAVGTSLLAVVMLLVLRHRGDGPISVTRERD